MAGAGLGGLEESRLAGWTGGEEFRAATSRNKRDVGLLTSISSVMLVVTVVTGLSFIWRKISQR